LLNYQSIFTKHIPVRTIVIHNLGKDNGRYTLPIDRFYGLVEEMTRFIIISIDDGYKSVYHCLMHERSFVTSNILLFLPVAKMGLMNDWDQSGELAGQPIMSWDNALELRRLGARIGSHGLNHVNLTKLCDADLERELRESKRLIEERTNTPVESLAYPFGYYNQRVIEFAQAAGYREAYTTCDSVLQGWRNPYRKRRIEIMGTDTNLLLLLKLSGLYDAKAALELPKLMAQKIFQRRTGVDNGNTAF
jgi:hypothetical protein